jgi:ATP-dependent Lhr-like helicase
MIKRIKKKYSKAQVLDLLDPIIREWFDTHFNDLTPPQAYAIPLIHKNQNVIVSSPTGSGKTLTAFLTIINELFQLSQDQKLENKVYCLYISPLKALANDIERNLNLPLKQIYSLAAEHGITLPEIRVGVRSGDTSTADRQKMLRKAPHILITTPESLSLIISTKRFRLKLLDTRFVIVDEIHELCGSKRGVHLSLSLERFQNQVLTEGSGNEFTRIGLSATQAPIEEMAKYLVGYKTQQKLRDINIIETPAGKKLDLKVLCPVKDMNLIPFEIINSKMYEMLSDLIDNHRTTLIFTNTRSGTENVVYRLQEHGLENIAAHHGSMSKETRLEVEEQLKNGELNATICSTSLELGIDIGYIDLVCQLGSPKSIAKGLQRVGRAGHALHEISKGRIIVFDRDDLVECAVLVKNAYEGNIDRISILKNSLDVLAQGLVGMSLEKPWEVDEAYSVVKRSYCYHSLSKKKFLTVLKYIAGKHSVEERGVYGKLRFHTDSQSFGIRHGARLIHNLNIGTIPQEANYRVILLESNSAVGVLSEKFVERLTGNDVFILGGKSYEFMKVRGMRVYVRSAHGKKPTVPSWTGEMLPRSFDLSCAIGRFRSELAKKLNDSKPAEVEAWLQEDYYLDSGSAKSIVNYFLEQVGMVQTLPTDKQVLIEGYIDGMGYRNIIFHYCFGRRVNDALSRAYAYALSKLVRCTIRISLSDNNFMLTLPKHIDLHGVEKVITQKDLIKNLRAALRNTEMLKQRFRHCAVRSFMILRNYKGKDISVRKQLRRSQIMLDLLHELEDFPVVDESYNEILHDAMDIENAVNILEKISNNDIKVRYSDYSTIPSPFAHNIILMGVSDIILLEDRSALLRELHQKVLRRVFKDLELTKPEFELEMVRNHFEDKSPVMKDKKSLFSLLKTIGPLHLFKERKNSVYAYAMDSVSPDTIQAWARELIAQKKLVSVLRNNNIFWIPRGQFKYYARVYSDDSGLSSTDHGVLSWLAASGSAGRNVLIHRSKSEKPDENDQMRYNILKSLEKRLLVHRSEVDSEGVVTWWPAAVATGPPDFGSAVEFLIIQYLKYFAPSTISELSYHLALDEMVITQILDKLVEANKVTMGYYILGKDEHQYMLADDFTTLNESSKFESPTVNSVLFRRFQFDNAFTLVDDIDAYFRKYGLAYSPREVFIRTRKFDLQTWNKYLAEKKLVQGRFLNGHVSFVPISDVSMYASAYRKAPLTAQEATVLGLIKHHRGITRLQLSEKLDARQIDIKEIIDKLERNLYIIRDSKQVELHNTSTVGTEMEGEVEPGSDASVGAHTIISSGISDRLANKYMVCEIKRTIKDSELKIIRKLIQTQGPLTLQELINYTGFSDKLINSCLKSLIAKDECVRFKIVDEGKFEGFVSKDDLESVLKYQPEPNTTGILKILSLFDSFSSRFMTDLRVRFGEGWVTPLIYSGRLVGILDLWRLASCVEIRDIILDSDAVAEVFHGEVVKSHDVVSQTDFENHKMLLLKLILKELDRLMKFYKMQGLDIIRIRKVFGHEPDEYAENIIDLLIGSGFSRVQDFWVKGRVQTKVFNHKQIMRLILHNQHVLPKSRFTNPLDVFRTFGGIRSTFEMRLRLDGRFYDLREFGKNLNLVSGPLIPNYFMYCTEKDLQLYKAAKSRKLDFNMEYILNSIPDHYSITANKLYDRLTLSKDQFRLGRKALNDGLFIVRDYMNRYRKVPSSRLLTKQFARKYVLKRILRNFGIFSIEGLTAFTRREYSVKELKTMLHELELEGLLVKGYFIENDDTLYWMTKDAVKSIENDNSRFNKYFIVSPKDQLATYMAPVVRQKFGTSTCYLIFHGFEITGTFEAKLKGNTVQVMEFNGTNDDWAAVEEFFRINKLDIIDEETQELYSDLD